MFLKYSFGGRISIEDIYLKCSAKRPNIPVANIDTQPATIVQHAKTLRPD